MCQVSKFHESPNLILLVMGAFIFSILQTKHRVVKKVAEDYTDLSGRAGTLPPDSAGHPLSHPSALLASEHQEYKKEIGRKQGQV